MSESDLETLERRLEAVERTVADGDHPRETQSPTTATADGVAERVETLESRVEELDAALQAVRGFLGGVDAVNESVEARAEAAVAAAERLERRLDERSSETERPTPDDVGVETRSSHDEPESRPGTADRSLGERLRDPW